MRHCIITFDYDDSEDSIQDDASWIADEVENMDYALGLYTYLVVVKRDGSDDIATAIL